MTVATNATYAQGYPPLLANIAFSYLQGQDVDR